jgi:hypothetical protein
MKRLIPLLLISNAHATNTGPNNVYIDQVGNTNLITIEQVGNTNNVGGITNTSQTTDSNNITTMVPAAPSTSNYATITGSSNQLAITQTGDINSAQYNIRGDHNSYTSTVTGDNNQTYLTIGVLGAPNVHNTVTETITGNSNLSIQKLIGDYITSGLIISGSTNQVTQSLYSSYGASTVTITGDSNVLFAEQSDSAGISGHKLIEYIVGNYNSISTQQQGSTDTVINIATSGDHNTITVRSSSSTIVNPITAIAR